MNNSDIILTFQLFSAQFTCLKYITYKNYRIKLFFILKEKYTQDASDTDNSYMEVKQIIVAEGFYYYFFYFNFKYAEIDILCTFFVYTKLCFKQCYASFASRLNYKKVRDRW